MRHVLRSSFSFNTERKNDGFVGENFTQYVSGTNQTLRRPVLAEIGPPLDQVRLQLTRDFRLCHESDRLACHQWYAEEWLRSAKLPTANTDWSFNARFHAFPLATTSARVCGRAKQKSPLTPSGLAFRSQFSACSDQPYSTDLGHRSKSVRKGVAKRTGVRFEHHRRKLLNSNKHASKFIG